MLREKHTKSRKNAWKLHDETGFEGQREKREAHATEIFNCVRERRRFIHSKKALLCILTAPISKQLASYFLLLAWKMQNYAMLLSALEAPFAVSFDCRHKLIKSQFADDCDHKFLIKHN